MTLTNRNSATFMGMFKTAIRDTAPTQDVRPWLFPGMYGKKLTASVVG